MECSLRPHLGGEDGMEWKGMKKIILEYSSILLFGSFNGENEKLIPLFRSLRLRLEVHKGREWNGIE